MFLFNCDVFLLDANIFWFSSHSDFMKKPITLKILLLKNLTTFGIWKRLYANVLSYGIIRH